MASIVVAGDTSGSVTLTAPLVAGTTTLTLPTVNGTVITTGSSGQSIPSAALPAGSVLQVVQGTQPAGVTNAGGTMITTGLTVSITPKFTTSKILMFVNGFARTPANGWINFRLYRGVSVIYDIVGGFNYQNGSTMTSQLAAVYLDSPATTASTTYALFFQNVNGTADWNADPRITTITAMEIAA
jgi:hypothetical protein